MKNFSTCDLIRIYPFIVFTLQSCTFYCGTTMNASFLSSFRRVIIFGGAGCKSCLIGLNYFVLSGNNRAIHVSKKNKTKKNNLSLCSNCRTKCQYRCICAGCVTCLCRIVLKQINKLTWFFNDYWVME